MNNQWRDMLVEQILLLISGPNNEEHCWLLPKKSNICCLFHSIRHLTSCTLLTSKYKKLLISKRRIGVLKKLPTQGENSESL